MNHHDIRFCLPPCNPINNGAPQPDIGVVQKLCVAKPSVPAETLREATYHACGDGGADCEKINPQGLKHEKWQNMRLWRKCRADKL
ncbi:hypothetical protein K1719_008585 [Acacia pycnantha]|nr:hypothetical protein K1719_008585 [Acacia pycnantha]